MATATAISTSSSLHRSNSFRDGYTTGPSSGMLYLHKRGGSNQLPIPRYPKTQPPSTPPPSIPTYDFQFEKSTPSPFKSRDLIPRTPDQSGYLRTGASEHIAYRDWSSMIPTLSPGYDGSAYRQVEPFKRPDALTPENSSEEDRELEETPIYLRSERYRHYQNGFQNGRLTPTSHDDEYDDTPSKRKRYSSSPENGISITAEPRAYETPIYVQRTSQNRRDITPSKIPIFFASPKPIPMEYIFRSSPLQRSPSGLDEYDAPALKRARSESLLDTTQTTPARTPTKPKFSTMPRPRSRSLSSMRTQFTARSKFTPSPGKRPPSAKGEPPWIQHAFSPSPYLPPEEQLLPTVAKRMNRERLEREKGLVTVWDREMRPLEGDKRIRDSFVKTHKEADDMPTGNIPLDAQAKEALEEKQWPLNEKQKARGSVYPPVSPAPLPSGGPVHVDARTLSTTLGPMQRFDYVQDRRDREKDDVKTGCCCIIM